MVVALAASLDVSRAVAGLFWSIFIILPIIGSAYYARSASRQFVAAVRAGVVCGAIQAVVYDFFMIAMLIGLDPVKVVATALFTLVVSVIAGALLGTVVGVGFVLTGRIRRRRKGVG